MFCEKCGSNNIQVIGNVHGKVHGGSLGQSLVRLCLIICTCGLWALFARKGRGKISTTTQAVCLNCGHKWRV